jgi:hypothetical protein
MDRAFLALLLLAPVAFSAFCLWRHVRLRRANRPEEYFTHGRNYNGNRRHR